MNRGSVRRFHVALMVASALLASLASCTSFDRQVGPAAHDLDDISEKVEEFGTASISAPLLSAPDKQFSFDLSSVTAQDLYKEAKTGVNGQFASFDQAASIGGIGVNISANLTAVAAAASELRLYQQAVNRQDAAQAATDEKNRLLDQAARTEYAQARADAEKLTDPSARAAALAAADRKLSSDLPATSAPTTLPAFPTATTVPAAPTNLTTRPTDAESLLGDKLGKFQALLAAQTAPTLDNRTALITAAGDNAIKAIFTALGDPQLGAKFKDKKVLFGVTTVAVNPGWRTRSGYAADVALYAQYEWKSARLEVVKNFVADERWDIRVRKAIAVEYSLGLPKGVGAPLSRGDELPEQYAAQEDNAAPLVSAVSPMTQTDVLDLESSRRRQNELSIQIAAALSAAGLNGAAQTFYNAVSSQQSDARTITPDIAVNTYSQSGQMFGFQVGPRLRALSNPASGKAKAGDLLDRQSFPALVILGLDDDDLRPRVQITNGHFELVERNLQFATVVNWLPLHQPRAFYGERLTEADRLRWAYNLKTDLQEKDSDPSKTVEGAQRALESLGQGVDPSEPDLLALNRVVRFEETELRKQPREKRTDAWLLHQFSERVAKFQSESTPSTTQRARDALRLRKIAVDQMVGTLESQKDQATQEEVKLLKAESDELGQEIATFGVARKSPFFEATNNEDIQKVQAVINDDCLKAYASAANPLDVGLRRLVLARAHALAYRAFGGEAYMPLPVDFVDAAAAPPTKDPKILEVIPSRVEVPFGVARRINLILLGNDLDALDASKAAIVIPSTMPAFASTKPATQAADVSSGGDNSSDAKPGAAKSDDTKSGDMKPANASASNHESGDTSSGGTKPSDPTSKAAATEPSLATTLPTSYARLAPDAQPFLRGGVLEVPLEVSEPGGPVVLEIPTKDGKHSIYSLPLTVELPRPVLIAPSIIQRTMGPVTDPAKQTMDRIEFQNVPEPVVTDEINRNRPASNPPLVDVKVQQSSAPVGH